MASAEKISITLPPDMLSTIKEKVETGAYGSTSEVIREAMRLWQRQEEEHETRLSAIRQRLERSAQSGSAVGIDAAFDQLAVLHQKTLAGNDENL